MATHERVTELITIIATDPGLRDRLATADPALRASILHGLGFGDITTADVAANAASFLPSAIQAVDDAELEAVAGGGGNDSYETTTTAGAAVSSAAAAT